MQGRATKWTVLFVARVYFGVSPILWVYLALGLWLVWFVVDCKGWSRFLRRCRQLDHEGKWEELEAHFRSEFNAFRPWVRLFLRFKSPSSLDGLAAAFFFQRGLTEESLRFAESAVAKAVGRPRVLVEHLRLQAAALTELARYDEARETIHRIRALDDDPVADHVESLLCLSLGRLDDAIGLADRARKHPKGELARHFASTARLLRGEDAAALEAVLEPARDVVDQYPAETLARMSRTREGRALIEGHRVQYAGVVEPLRFLQAGYVYLDQSNAGELGYLLEKASAVMGGNPSLKVMHAQLSACHCALIGDVAGADRRLREGAKILETHRRRGSVMEFHRFAGRAHLLLGRADAAVAELERSRTFCVHPLEKHLGGYWLAKAYEAKGESGKAAELLRTIASDGIVSKYAKASPPAPSGPTPAS